MNNNIGMQKIKSKCAVCGEEVLIDQWGNGHCDNCGWEQSVDCIDFPNEVRYPNRVSYKKAKELYASGSLFFPTFEDFLQMFSAYDELEIKYQSRWFGIVVYDKKIQFFESKKKAILFDNIEEFANKASIDDKLLKDIWQDIEYADYMECCERE